MAKKGKGFFGALGSALSSIPVVGKVKKAVKKKIKKAKKKLKKALKKAKKKLKKKLGKVLTKARKLKNNLSKSKLVKRFKKAVKKAVKKAKKYVKKVVKTVKKAAKTAVKAVKKAAKTTVKAVKKAVKTTVKAVKTAAKTTVKAVKTAAKTTVKAVKTATKAAVKTVKTAAKTAVKVAKSATKKAAVFVKSVSISQAISTVADFIPIVGNVKAAFETAFGFNPITLEKLSAVDRGISAVGILGGGFAKVAGKGGKATLNLFSKSKNATNATESAAKSSKNAASAKGDITKATDEVEKLQRGKYADHLDKLHDKYGKLTPEQINQRINLRGETMNELERLKQVYNGKPNFGKDKMGPALAGVYDKKTGKYYHDINTIDGAVPELAPLLRNRLDNMPKEVFDSYSKLSKGAGSHAEVLAVNKALMMNPSARIEDLTVNVIRTGINKNKPGGTMFKCCPHCSYLLDGFEVISEVSKVER
ncbi:YwqJ-related putative deaminase [Lysinibacillus sp. NPDC093190]|uniref:YwqJ-related putative deaminase n=1 Tax=Lysinibacillus sp. NPDC093190 TaxID=3390575 RepID=UPI003D0006F1